MKFTITGVVLAEMAFAVHGANADGKAALNNPTQPSSNAHLFRQPAALPHRQGDLWQSPPSGPATDRSRTHSAPYGCAIPDVSRTN